MQGAAPKNATAPSESGFRRAVRRFIRHLDGRQAVLRAWLLFGPPRSRLSMVGQLTQSRLSMVGQLTQSSPEPPVHLSVRARRIGARRYELVGAGQLGVERCWAYGELSDGGSGPELLLRIESESERLSFRASWQALPPAILAAGAAFEGAAVGAADSGRGIVMRLDYRDLARSWTEWQRRNRPHVQ